MIKYGERVTYRKDKANYTPYLVTNGAYDRKKKRINGAYGMRRVHP